MDIKRNLTRSAAPKLSQALGTEAWQDHVKKPDDVTKAIDVLRAELAKQGCTGAHVRSEPIRNSKNNILYHLVFVSKNGLGDKIWNSVTNFDATGQRRLF